MSNFDSDNDFCNSICDESNYYEPPTNSYFAPVYASENQGAHQMQTDDDYWKSPCSDSPKYIRKFPSNESVIQSSPTSSSYHYVPVYQNDKLGEYICDDYYGSNRVHSGTTNYNCNGNIPNNNNNNHDLNKNLNLVGTTNHMPVVRVIKKRTTANKKERRRTQSINSAYTSLRDHIPNVPADTKLSKIKTLRLATSYISYLIAVLGGEQDSSRGFRAELVPSSRKINAERRAQMKKEIESQIQQQQQKLQEGEVKKRTGWPQSVWGSATRKSIK